MARPIPRKGRLPLESGVPFSDVMSTLNAFTRLGRLLPVAGVPGIDTSLQTENGNACRILRSLQTALQAVAAGVRYALLNLPPPDLRVRRHMQHIIDAYGEMAGVIGHHIRDTRDFHVAHEKAARFQQLAFEKRRASEDALQGSLKAAFERLQRTVVARPDVVGRDDMGGVFVRYETGHLVHFCHGPVLNLNLAATFAGNPAAASSAHLRFLQHCEVGAGAEHEVGLTTAELHGGSWRLCEIIANLKAIIVPEFRRAALAVRVGFQVADALLSCQRLNVYPLRADVETVMMRSINEYDEYCVLPISPTDDGCLEAHEGMCMVPARDFSGNQDLHPVLRQNFTARGVERNISQDIFRENNCYMLGSLLWRICDDSDDAARQHCTADMDYVPPLTRDPEHSSLLAQLVRCYARLLLVTPEMEALEMVRERLAALVMLASVPHFEARHGPPHDYMLYIDFVKARTSMFLRNLAASNAETDAFPLEACDFIEMCVVTEFRGTALKGSLHDLAVRALPGELGQTNAELQGIFDRTIEQLNLELTDARDNLVRSRARIEQVRGELLDTTNRMGARERTFRAELQGLRDDAGRDAARALVTAREETRRAVAVAIDTTHAEYALVLERVHSVCDRAIEAARVGVPVPPIISTGMFRLDESVRPRIDMGPETTIADFEVGERIGGGANAVVFRGTCRGVPCAIKVTRTLFENGVQPTAANVVALYEKDWLLPDLAGLIHAPVAEGYPDLSSFYVIYSYGKFIINRNAPEVREPVDAMKRDMLAAMEIDGDITANLLLAIVYPLAEETLQADLARRRLAADAGVAPLFTAREWTIRALQLLKGLALMHRKNVVHRDVKLDNIFLCATRPGEEPNMVIGDFGEAMQVEAGTQFVVPYHDGIGGGAPQFTAPEVLVAMRARRDINYEKNVRALLIATSLYCPHVHY